MMDEFREDFEQIDNDGDQNINAREIS